MSEVGNSLFEFALLCGLFFGILCAYIAPSRGKKPLLFFFLGFLFSFFPFLYLLSLEKTQQELSQEDMAKKEQGRRDENLITQIQSCENAFIESEKEKTWFYVNSDREKESISFVELRKFWKQGVVNETTWVWSKGMSQWAKIKDLVYLHALLSSS